MSFNSVKHYLPFYTQAVTKYQLHSPAIFAIVMAAMEDSRRYYAFDEIPEMRRMMLHHAFHASRLQQKQFRKQLREKAPNAQLGERLFRILQHFAPDRIGMLGSGAGLGCLYAATAARQASLDIFESDHMLAGLAKANLEFLKCNKPIVWHQSQRECLKHLADYDILICFQDTDWTEWERLQLTFGMRLKACIVVGMHGTADGRRTMTRWQKDPAMKASVDFFDVTVWLPDTGFREAQHVKVVPAWYKPWKFY